MKIKYIQLLMLIVLLVYCPLVFPNYQDERKSEEQLQEASTYGDIEEVTRLIKAGVNVNTKDERGFTPLMYAASRGKIEIVNLLIKAGSDVNIKNNYGDTALMRSSEVKENIEQLIDIFISNGANLEEKNKEGWTVLLITASNMNVEMVKELIKRGADVYARNKFDQNLLTIAVMSSDINVVKFILESNYCNDINSKDKKGKTPLMWAVICRHKPIIELLVKAGSDAHCIDKFDKTAFDYASKDEDVKRVLLRAIDSIKQDE